MSVSDDSKMKLIEVKYKTLYEIYNQIEDEEFRKCFTLCEMRHKEPKLYELISKYEKASITSTFDVLRVQQSVLKLIKDKCIKVLEQITGKDISATQMSDSDIQNLMSSKLEQLNAELTEAEKLSKSFDKKFETYQKLFGQYLDAVAQYYSKYKLDFKLSYDEHMANLLMSKAQALCLRERHTETQAIAHKYGSKETIQKLKEERKALESEEFRLKMELKKAEEKLCQYDTLDKDLFKQYRHLKDELDYRYWAITELNQSSESASNGSINGASD